MVSIWKIKIDWINIKNTYFKMNLFKNILRYNGHLIKELKFGNSISVLHNCNKKEYILDNKFSNSIYDVPMIRNKHKCWLKYGLSHRENDQPALINLNGDVEWYFYGKLHRDNDEPAMIYANGNKYWYENGKCHRDNDQPAIICKDGSKYWYQNGELHRYGNRPAMIYPNGKQYCYKYGKLIKN